MATDEDALFASFNNLSTRPAAEAETAPAVEKEDFATWDNARVIKHLQTLGMPETVLAKIKEFEVTGEDLATLTVQELKADLEITKLQATRIKRSLDSDDPAGEEAQEKKDIEDARAQSVTGTLAAPADLSAAEEPLTAATLQSHSSVTRNRSPGLAALGMVVGLPVAPSAPTGPVTAASLQVDQNLVNEWATKTALITKLEQDQVGEKLPSASQRLVYLKQNFADETAKFKELQKVNEKLTVKYTELEGGAWYPGKYLLGKHRREKKLDHAKDKASDTSRKLEAAGKLVENLAVKIEHQEQLVTELNVQVRALVQAKKWEENALLTAFSGIAGDAKENALEREVAVLVPQLEQTRRYKTSYSQAYEHIHSARKMLEKAAQLFRSAYGLSGIDVAQNFFKPRQFRNTPAGLMVDVAKRAQSRQGVALCDQAAVSIQRASQIIPDMPRVDLQKVKGLRGLGVMDVVFDNMISDLIARRRIRECMELVSGQLSDTRYAEKWLEGWISGRIDQDLRALESSYALKKNELDNYRRGLLQMLVDSSSRRPAS